VGWQMPDQRLLPKMSPELGPFFKQLQLNPIMVTKAVDKSSPLLFEALSNNRVVDAQIKVLTADHSGIGLDEEVLRYTLTGGTIAGHRINVSDIPTDVISPFETETLSLVSPPLW